MKITRGNKVESVLCNNLAFMVKDIRHQLGGILSCFLLFFKIFLSICFTFVQDNIKCKNFSYTKVKNVSCL